jgi:predicted metal-dependent phosphoesterase TrpH
MDFHVHTNNSFDCQTKLDHLVARMRRTGMDGFAITDHNSFEIFDKELPKYPDIEIIRGMEIHTEHGDLLGLFLTKPLRCGRFEDAVDEIRGQGGISVLPHPYRGHTDIEGLAKAVDVIEAFNGLTKHKENRKAAELAKRLNKPVVASSDAHILSYIGICYTVVDRPIRENLLRGNTKLVTGYPSFGARIRNRLREIKYLLKRKKIRHL